MPSSSDRIVHLLQMHSCQRSCKRERLALRKHMRGCKIKTSLNVLVASDSCLEGAPRPAL
eukprot:2987860-Amphidinium_carterae.1